MRARAPLALTAVLALVATGCNSSGHYPGEERAAKRQVDRAEAAGADKHSADVLASARRAIEQARESEEAANADWKAARKDHERALDAESTAGRRLAQRRSAHHVESGVREDELREQDALAKHRAELVASGATPEDLSRTSDVDLSLARARVRSSDAVIAALEESVRLGELEQREARLSREQAEARMKTCEQRLALARSLYGDAENLGRLAEAESLEARRARLAAEHPIRE